MNNLNSYWKPFNRADNPSILEVVSGQGVNLYDKDGKKYFDGYSGLWNMPYGYDDEDIKNAIIDQLNTLPYVNPITINYPKIEELSQLLCRILHKDIDKIIYTCSGSESNEVAIKLARKYSALKGSSRKAIGVVENSYHGSYYGSMSASTYEGKLREGYGPMLSGFVSLPMPFTRDFKIDEFSTECKEKIVSRLNEELAVLKDHLCAIIIEPIIASGGIIPLFDEYIRALYEVCQDNDILFVCDEVATGFGRTGELFCFQHFNIKPDIITLSKGINNGYLPLGATCVTKKVVQQFINNKEIIFHLSTQNGNPLSVAAALANINKMLQDNTLEKVRENSAFISKTIKNDLCKFNSIFDIRCFGMMFAIDIVDENDKPIPKEKLSELMQRIYSLGCIMGSAYVEGITSAILVLPPFIATKGDIKKLSKIISKAIIEVNLF
ncbi:MAG: aspartate aminotransferase family protein [Syntrophaceticus sp.]|nr:aspartate aminotransferase family protein [Syntrophaceticus sp.]MDD3314003.1 aspartate aminotransferase family protein [Syntrophaceticus sp.]MDD4359312.1 aspartate aminotransferase family protein [Syntrophaceticus sp.]MDD4782284.1 aspartate aminotransferase family protein [Syntrophaceticus sp.]